MFEVAVAGSKLEGTALAKEHMTQTHVAVVSLGLLDPDLWSIELTASLKVGEALEGLEGGCLPI